MTEVRHERPYTIILVLSFIAVYLLLQQQYGIFTQPYFWDELGVYSRSSLHLFYHGLSLLPSGVSDELSRGHPLLCPFYFAVAFKVLGCTPLSAHLAAACLNMLGFWFCFRILLRYIYAPLAVFATLAIFVQPLFLSQSVLVLPEMPLMVTTLGAVHAYVRDRKWAAMLWLVAALQLKESALVLPIAFLLADAVNHKKIRVSSLVFYFLLPFASFIIFICIQKYQRGYFFYPLHTSLASFDMYYIRERWLGFTAYFIDGQGRYGIWIMTCITVCLFMAKNRHGLKNMLMSRLLVIPVAIAGALSFLVLNYYLSRYTAYFVVLFYMLLSVLIVKVFNKYPYLQWLLIGIILCNGIYNWNNGREYTDVDFSYTDHIRTVEMVVEELDRNYRHEKVGMDFPLSAAYWNRENGYKTGNDVQWVPIYDSLPARNFLVFMHPGNIADTAKYSGRIKLMKEFRSGYAFAKIYRLEQH